MVQLAYLWGNAELVAAASSAPIALVVDGDAALFQKVAEVDAFHGESLLGLLVASLVHSCRRPFINGTQDLQIAIAKLEAVVRAGKACQGGKGGRRVVIPGGGRWGAPRVS
eukprot:GILK01022345.1.p2 GENE.GILK01022345.1~~GILK01022345.1.p2  ORF type:complete len:111 (-),score=3.74 GILK01022345.1:286-618(-)